MTENISYEGPSMAIEQTTLKMDVHCPLMGGPGYRLNYWEEKCQSRQKDGYEKHKDCFGGCKAARQIEKNNRMQHHSWIDKNAALRVEIHRLIDIGYSNEEICKKVNRAIRTISAYRREKGLGIK